MVITDNLVSLTFILHGRPGPVGFELGGVLYSNLSEESELTLDGTGFQHLCSEIDSRLRLRRKSKSK